MQQHLTPRQQLQSPSYLAQFDPCAVIGRAWGEMITIMTTITNGVSLHDGYWHQLIAALSSSHIYIPVPSSTQPTSVSTAGDQHPREYTQQHNDDRIVE
jgi:hypothetical protein